MPSDPRYMRAVVTSRRDVTADLWVIRLRPESRLAFQPGQYVAAGLEGSEGMVERPYSIASSPEEEELEFFLELVPGGKLSPRLYTIGPKDEIYLRRTAKGLFRWDEASGNRNHFLVATVTGVAPFISMVRQRSRAKAPGEERVILVQSASLSMELGYREELAGYARELPWFRYVPVVSRIWLDGEWQGERGRAEDVIRKYLDAAGWNASNTTAYLCGHPGMIANARGVLERAGFSSKSIRQEMFWVR
jgi:ferredoxin/flavodoxin---NADP+ reductase